MDLWNDFMNAPGYFEYSPWFPNPFICARDMISSGGSIYLELEVYLNRFWLCL